MRTISIFLFLMALGRASAPLAVGPSINQSAMLQRIIDVEPSLAVGRPTFGSAVYALVDDAQLSDLVADCWVLLRKQGILISPFKESYGWRARFNCTDFTSAFILTARLRHSREGESEGHPAIFAVGYQQDGRSGLTIGQRQQPRFHSVAMIFTPAGVVFVDPVVGRIALSAAERSTLYWYIP